MSVRTPHVSFRSILLMVLLLPGPALSAAITCTQASTGEDSPPRAHNLPEMEEVVVRAGKVARRTRDLGAWLERLEGQFHYSGHVERCGGNNTVEQVPVTGKADCVSLYSGTDESRRSLYCVIDVRWPRGSPRDGDRTPEAEPDLSPAVIIYGVVPELPGIQLMQLDSSGVATYARGRVTGDTLVTTTSCDLPGICRRVTRITARPESGEVAIQVDVERDSRRTVRHAFVLRRVSNHQLARTPFDPLSRDDLRRVGER